ncbi:MAG TPA: YbdD/YjiX family protein [Gemmatimonadales bacterium]
MWDRRTGGQAVRRSLARVGAMLQRIAGMPDYGAYVEHLRRCHPERAVPTEREYFEQYVAARYGDGPTRCC